MLDIDKIINEDLLNPQYIVVDEMAIKSFNKLPIKIREVSINSHIYNSLKYNTELIKDVTNDDIKALIKRIITPLVDKKSALIYANKSYPNTGVGLGKLICDLVKVMPFDETIIAECINGYGQAIANAWNKKVGETLASSYDASTLINILEEIVTKENLKYHPKQDEWIIDNNEGNCQVVSDAYVRDLITNNMNRRMIIDKTIKPVQVLSELDDFKKKIELKKFFDIQNNIKYAADEEFRHLYLKKWYDLFKIKQDYDIWEVLISHWIWMVKRRLIHQSTVYEIMIAIHGKQGIGKSYFYRRILGDVLGDLYDSSITLERLCDERCAKIRMDNFAINIEELTNSGSSDFKGAIKNQVASGLKKIITEANDSYRPLFTNQSEKIINNACLLSTANYHLQEVINDESGMRRFFEFESALLTNQTVNLIDPESTEFLYNNSTRFFRSINESLDRGYFDPESEIAIRIRGIQDSYIKKNSFSEFLEISYTLIQGEAKNDQYVTKKKLLENYSTYCKEMAIDEKYMVRNLDLKISDMFGEDAIKKIHNQNMYKLAPKSDSLVGIIDKDEAELEALHRKGNSFRGMFHDN